MQMLDEELSDVVTEMNDDDLKKTVDRGFPIQVETQLQVYLQALLIFLGKASIFLKVLGKPLTKELRDWIW